jgi:NADP-dependent 3-hydroxy acid dehydrogenase YdfG
MTKIALKGMKERNSGAIVNLSSVSGTAPMGS